MQHAYRVEGPNASFKRNPECRRLTVSHPRLEIAPLMIHKLFEIPIRINILLLF